MQWSKLRGEKLKVAGSSPGVVDFLSFRSLKPDRVGRTKSDPRPVQLRPPGSEPDQPPTTRRLNEARPSPAARRQRPTASGFSPIGRAPRARAAPDQRTVSHEPAGRPAGMPPRAVCPTRPSQVRQPAGRRWTGERSSGRRASTKPAGGQASVAELPARTTPSEPRARKRPAGLHWKAQSSQVGQAGASSAPAEQKASEEPARRRPAGLRPPDGRSR